MKTRQNNRLEEIEKRFEPVKKLLDENWEAYGDTQHAIQNKDQYWLIFRVKRLEDVLRSMPCQCMPGINDWNVTCNRCKALREMNEWCPCDAAKKALEGGDGE